MVFNAKMGGLKNGLRSALRLFYREIRPLLGFGVEIMTLGAKIMTLGGNICRNSSARQGAIY